MIRIERVGHVEDVVTTRDQFDSTSRGSRQSHGILTGNRLIRVPMHQHERTANSSRHQTGVMSLGITFDLVEKMPADRKHLPGSRGLDRTDSILTKSREIVLGKTNGGPGRGGAQ